MSLHLQAGRVVGNRYALTRPIASGGMGDVWEATDTVLDRDVAVKILRTGDGPADEGFTERFRDEAKHAAALTHPNVAAVYDYGEEEDGTAYLVMERVPGVPLTEVIRASGGLDPQQVRSILGQAALALAAAHDSGLVHRDVKPGNIIVTPEGMAKLTDFGIARAGDGNGHTLTGEVLGTPDYISPEQALGEQATNASDIYALGVVGHEMLVGAKPFDMGSPVATALAHVNDMPPTLPDTVPADLRTVIEACMAKSPGDRPSDAREVALALGMAADPVAPVVAVAAATTRLFAITPTTPRWQTRAEALAIGDAPRDRNRRRAWILAPVAILAIILLFGLGQAFGEDGNSAQPPAPAATSTPVATTTAPTPTTATPSTSASRAAAPAPAPAKPAPEEKSKGKPDDPGKGKGNK
jgi:serine/threonine-protein kinase